VQPAVDEENGYELRKELAQVLGGLRSISYGSLYPALKRMHAAGLIATEDPDRHALLPADAPPLTGRRGKVVYTITAEGKERFQSLVSEAGPSAWEDDSFSVHLAFFARTDAEEHLLATFRQLESWDQNVVASLADMLATRPGSAARRVAKR